jgi:hypothetical protein
MKPDVRLLLPLLSNEELDLFISTPAEALLSPGNLSALAAETKVVLCLLSPADVAEKFERTSFRKAIATFAELLWVSVDEMVLDYPFEVVPSLACQKGIASSGPDATETAFIFLQPNLVLADGALRAISCQIQAGMRILRTTYLRVDRAAFEAGFAGSAVETRFAPRTMIDHAVECLDLREVGSFININAPLMGPAERLIWRHDARTLLIYDFAMALIALWPTRAVTRACGFRDSMFAEAMCPGGASHHFTDSDEFCGVEIAKPAVSNNAVRFGSQSIAERAQGLAACTTMVNRQSAIQFPVAFHADDLSTGLAGSLRMADSYVKRVNDAAGSAEGNMLQARWKAAYYLWSVRLFELGRGLLPDGPFAELFGHSHANQPARNTAVESRPLISLSAKKYFSLMGLLRWLRQRALGQVPFVSFLHPEWPNYRCVAPLLRQAALKPRTQVAYVADGAGIFSRVLGQPDFTTAELVDGCKAARMWGSATPDIAIFELTSASFGDFATLTADVLPSLRPGGQIIIYHRNEGELSHAALSNILTASFAKLGTRRIARISVSAVTPTPYRRWLSDGFPLAVKLARPRRLINLAYGGALAGLVCGLMAISNVVGSRSRQEASKLEPVSSVTIVLPADEPTSS